MKKVKLLNKMAKVGLDELPEGYVVGEDVSSPEAILVRSADMHSYEMNPELLAIARAGAGVNNIPIAECASKGIVVFNTPGANANAVKELVLAGLLLASRDIVGGIEWVKDNSDDPSLAKSVEKNKSRFAGCEIRGKKLGVIGLGAIGGALSNAADHLGMKVYGCDPYITIDAAWNISRSVVRVKTREEIYSECDYITLHVPLIDDPDPNVRTKHMINEESIAKMKDGVIILNFARGALVDYDALKAALSSGKVKAYVTDFPEPQIASEKGVIAIPHLGASTEESEDNCAVMSARQVADFLENGNIKNSVNYPDVVLPESGEYRLCVLHKNIPGIVAQLAGAVANEGLNISNMINKSRGDYAYTVIEISGELPDHAVEAVSLINGVIRTRAIK